LDYDDVLNEQRNFMYSERDAILTDEHLLQRVMNSCHEIADAIVDGAFASSKDTGEPGIKILEEIESQFHLAVPPLAPEAKKDDYKKHVNECIDKEVNDKVALTGEKPFNDFLRFNYLRQVDIRWQDHLTALEDLRDAVGLRSYAQKNPLVEYKVEGFEIFTQMLEDIKAFMANTLVRVQITRNEDQYARKAASHRTVETHNAKGAFSGNGTAAQRQQQGGETSPVTVRRTTAKIGRNDPCPCGSGKKYKNCHGKNA
jgi:preprotein translocase subunit SecA